MRHGRTPAIVVALTLTLAATPAAAKMTYRDAAADANAVNTQGKRGLGHDGDVSTGPASVRSADITGVSFTPRYRNGRVSGYAVTVAVAGKVTRGTMFSVAASTGACSVVVKHVRPAVGETVTDAGSLCEGGHYRVRELAPAVVRGSRVTINVPLSALPRQIKVGTVLREIYAYTVAAGSDVEPFLHAPKLDIAATRRSYRIGS